jgi:UDP-N-acetylmuramyl pentapeptide synthase
MQLSLLMRGIETMGTTGDSDGKVASVCYDSRQCCKGSLFVAIPGLKTDGHRFIGRSSAASDGISSPTPLPGSASSP